MTAPTSRLADPAAYVEERRRSRLLSRVTDGEERFRLLPVTSAAMADLSPTDWIDIARFLHALVIRPGLAGPQWEAHRFLVGSLVSELYMEARARGEEMPEPTRAELAEWQGYLDRTMADQSRHELGRAREKAFGRRG
jgi:hypothetical protein